MINIKEEKLKEAIQITLGIEGIYTDKLEKDLVYAIKALTIPVVSRTLKADFAKGEEVTFNYRLLGEIEEIENDRFTINRDGKRYVINRKNISEL